MWASCNFSVRESLPLPVILPGRQGWSQTSNVSSVSKAQDTCQKEAKKVDLPSAPPDEQSPPTSAAGPERRGGKIAACPDSFCLNAFHVVLFTS